MNTVTTIKIDRPPDISDDQPCPVPLNNTFLLQLHAEWNVGLNVNLTDAKIYITIKADLDDADGAALVQLNSTDDASYFTISTPSNGRYTITLPAGYLSSNGLSADTNYYIDTEIIPSGGDVFTHLYDVIRPFTSVTGATS